jgi:hypothetical protein
MIPVRWRRSHVQRADDCALMPCAGLSTEGRRRWPVGLFRRRRRSGFVCERLHIVRELPDFRGDLFMHALKPGHALLDVLNLQGSFFTLHGCGDPWERAPLGVLHSAASVTVRRRRVCPVLNRASGRVQRDKYHGGICGEFGASAALEARAGAPKPSAA